jgi:hypothetical protein
VQEQLQTGDMGRRTVGMLSLPTSLVLLALNVVGACIFIARASIAWAIPAERAAGIYSVTGEPFVWFAAILPVVAVFVVIDLTWGALVLTRRQWRSGGLLLVSASIWLVAALIDNLHH